MDLIEAEDMKKRWQEYTEELYKKDLHDPDNHDGVITQKLYRQAKAERIKHHQTSSPTNAKGYSLDRTHKKGV